MNTTCLFHLARLAVLVTPTCSEDFAVDTSGSPDAFGGTMGQVCVGNGGDTGGQPEAGGWSRRGLVSQERAALTPGVPRWPCTSGFQGCWGPRTLGWTEDRSGLSPPQDRPAPKGGMWETGEGEGEPARAQAREAEKVTGRSRPCLPVPCCPRGTNSNFGLWLTKRSLIMEGKRFLSSAGDIFTSLHESISKHR